MDESRLEIVDVDKLPVGVLDFKASETEKLMIIDGFLARKVEDGGDVTIKYGAKATASAKATFDIVKDKEPFQKGNIGLMCRFLNKYYPANN